jgi:hypothetical protein
MRRIALAALCWAALGGGGRTETPENAATVGEVGTGALAASPAEAAFAAGFAGDYARAVLLDRQDAVTGCRASSVVDEHRAVEIERRRDKPPTLALKSALIFDVVEIPGQLVIGERRFPTVGEHGPQAYVIRLDEEATAALMKGAAAAVDYDGTVIPLPGNGLAAAVAFAARCRFG